MSITTGVDILDKILHRKAAEVAEAKDRRPAWELEQAAIARSTPHSLAAALVAQPGVSLIAEVKHASPSKGVLIDPFDAVGIARDYVFSGASAISVLTDRDFFRGSLEDLSKVRRLCRELQRPIPLLRKDFIIDEYQILEARAAGADAVLLIVAALTDAALAALHAEAQRWGLEVLVEVHDERELDRAAAVGARLIGVNNRDLRTFTVDLATTERLVARRPPNVVFVSESGIQTRSDVLRLAAHGVDAMLVGESLVVAKNRRSAARALLGLPEPKPHQRSVRDDDEADDGDR